VNNVILEQKAKAYIVNGGFVSAKLLETTLDYPLPENVFIIDIRSEWRYPNISLRKNIVKKLELFDPIKIAVSIDSFAYKFEFVNSFLNSWSIRGPGIDEKGDSSSLDNLPCDLVDIMYEGIMGITKKAEDELGKA